MLEKMSDFFNNRTKEYEQHQMNHIDSASKFYPFTADCLPKEPDAEILDLGCGTGLELDYFFQLNPTARVTGIDLSSGMLEELKKKFVQQTLRIILGSFFDVPFKTNFYDAAVSVEAMHHFTKEEKISLYRKLHQALKLNGYFILTDYFSLSDEEEKSHQSELEKLKQVQGIQDKELYHFDIPLTIQNEIEALTTAGFSSVEILESWGATSTIKAIK